jgi:hypothetical protein
LLNYARQQYGFGYGRLDLVAKHRHRAGGDNVSRTMMMLHGPMMAAAIVLAIVALGFWLAGRQAALPGVVAGLLVGALVAERFVAGLIAAIGGRDRAGLWFVPVHLVRDVSWALAIVLWGLRRLRGAPAQPRDSMPPARARE